MQIIMEMFETHNSLSSTGSTFFQTYLSEFEGMDAIATILQTFDPLDFCVTYS